MLALLALTTTVDANAGESTLVPRATEQHDLTLQSRGAGAWEARTSGTDPYFYVDVQGDAIDLAKTPILEFACDSEQPVGRVLVFVGAQLDLLHLVTVARMERDPNGLTTIDLTATQQPPAAPLRQLRITLGERAGLVATVKNLRVRGFSAEEQQAFDARQAKRKQANKLAARLADYLKQEFPNQITRVTAAEKQIQIEGRLGESADHLKLAAAPMWSDATTPSSLAASLDVKPREDGTFIATVDRFDADGRDRLLDGWALLRSHDDKVALASAVHYVDSQTARAELPAASPTSRRGMGGCPFDHPDMKDLGIDSVTLNIVLNDYIYAENAPGRTPYVYGGKTWYTNDRVVAEYDRMLRDAAERHCMVSSIILVRPNRRARAGSWEAAVCHPDADAGAAYVMPNLATRDGVIGFAAVMNFLAERYSRPDGRYGRIHHWIMHNEINSGYYWTSAGDLPLLAYLDLYQKSMRLTQTLARQYDPHAKALISLDHWWGRAGDARGYAGKELLERLVDFSRREGDFDWAIAFHPYAQDLMNPRTWEDAEAVFRFDTPFITFKNLEVLDAWARRPSVVFGDRPFREVQLTEQGLNSRDYSEHAMREQAAGLAYAWAKIAPLKTITAFQYHIWADAREEGGLRLGVRKFSDEPGDPFGRKPSWSVFQAIETDRWEAATEFARPIVGVKDWSEVHYSGAIE